MLYDLHVRESVHLVFDTTPGDGSTKCRANVNHQKQERPTPEETDIGNSRVAQGIPILV